MRITISNDFNKLFKDLNDIQKKQIPFATARALSQTASLGVTASVSQAKKDIDRPTPFTLRGFASLNASKSNLQAHVFIKPIQAEYLKYQIDGGTREDKKGSPVIAPGKKLKLNQYGNIGRYRLRGKSSKKIFVSDDGVIFERLRDSINILAMYRAKAEYKKRLNYYEALQASAIKTFPITMDKSIDDALRTAK